MDPYIVPFSQGNLHEFMPPELQIDLNLRMRSTTYMIAAEYKRDVVIDSEEWVQEDVVRGSGVCVTLDGHILTAYHIVKDRPLVKDGEIVMKNGKAVMESPTRVCARRHGEEFHTCELVNYSTAFDLALLQIDDPPLLRPRVGGSSRDEYYFPLQSEKSNMSVGYQVFTIGAPLGQAFYMLNGSISYPNYDAPVPEIDPNFTIYEPPTLLESCLYKYRTYRLVKDFFASNALINHQDISKYLHPNLPVLQMNLKGTPGLSGGPIFDAKGFLVGTILGGSQHCTLGVPVSAIVKFLEKAI